MNKTLAEQMDDLNAAVLDLRQVIIREFAATRVARFLGWFYEWERVRIGDRLAKVATIVLAVNILWIWPVALIEVALNIVTGK